MTTEIDRTKSGRHPDEDEHEKHDRDTLKVTVFAPRFPKGRKFSWDKHLIVGAAAQAAATEFGYGAGTFTLAKKGVALDRDKALFAVGVRDRDELELVDTGGGV